MLDQETTDRLAKQLYQLCHDRANDSQTAPANDLNELIADVINGLETLFIIINARVAQESNPQAKAAVFVPVSTPEKKQFM